MGLAAGDGMTFRHLPERVDRQGWNGEHKGQGKIRLAGCDKAGSLLTANQDS
jgi:hypothetical protein